MSRIVFKYCFTYFFSNFRVEDVSMTNVLTRNSVVVRHHDLVNLINSESPTTIATDGWMTAERNFDFRDNSRDFIYNFFFIV